MPRSVNLMWALCLPLSVLTATVAAWIAACMIVVWIALILPFQLAFCKIVYLFSGLPTPARLRLLLLTPCNVNSLKYNDTDVLDHDNYCLHIYNCAFSMNLW